MTNIADETQVKKQGDDFKKKALLQSIELKKLLEQKPFRDFVWRLLGKSRMFETIWEQSARIHYNAGQQDFGHSLWAELEAASQEAVFQMMRENKKEEKPND